MNSPSPPDPLVFFIDRSLGRKVIANALRDAGEKVEIHDDHFPQNTVDDVWLCEVGRCGWVVLTKDANIRYHANELAALRSASVRAFILTARGDLSGPEMAEIFIKALPGMKRLIARTSGPLIARNTRAGDVEVIEASMRKKGQK